MINKHRGTTRGVRKWLTKTQLVAHFQSEKVAEAVVQRKRDTPGLQAEIRDHPELPDPYLRFHDPAHSKVDFKIDFFICQFRFQDQIIFVHVLHCSARTGAIFGAHGGRRGAGGGKSDD